MLRILHIDDDIFEQELVAINLTRLADDLVIEWSESAVLALEKLEEEEYDLIISDYQMPEMNGLEFLGRIRQLGYDIPLIFVTGQGNEKLAAESFREGASDYFTKEESFAHYDRLLNSIRRVATASIHNREFKLTERKYKKLYEDNIAGVFQTSVEGEMLECNKAFKKILGYDENLDLFGFKVADWYWDNSHRSDFLNKIMLHGRVNNYELHLINNKGEDVWLLNNAVLLAKRIIQGTVVDITQRKLAELAIERSEEQLRRLVELFPTAIQIHALDGTLINANKAWGELWQADNYQTYFGEYNIYQDSQLAGPGLEQAFEKVKNGETVDTKAFTYDPAISNIKGRKRVLKCRLYPLYDKHGEVESIVISSIDETQNCQENTISRELPPEAKEKNPLISDNYPAPTETLSADYYNKSICSAIMNNTADIIFAKDSSGKYISVNKALLSAFNITSEEIIGEKDDKLFGEETKSAISAGDARVLKGETIAKTNNFRIGNTDRLMHVIKTPFFDGDGKIAGIVGVSRDVSESYQKEIKLEEMNKLLVQANKELEAFSYSVSHDLKAPIRHIEAYAGVLLEEDGNRDTITTRKYLENIYKSSRRMKEIVDGMLILAGISEAKMEVEVVDFSQLCREVMEELFSRQNQGKVRFMIADNLEVMADRSLLKIAMENLLGNAVKYSQNVEMPFIEVGSSFKDGVEVFFIKDNGEGFDNSLNKEIFHPFRRFYRGKDISGTGVGLATVDRVFKKHNGSIRAESAPGQGAIFYLTLPE